MMTYLDVTAKTEEEAVSKALATLGMERDDVSVEILERAKSGLFGLRNTPAKIRVHYDDGKKEPIVETVAEEKTAAQPVSAAASDKPFFAPEILQKANRPADSRQPMREKHPVNRETEEVRRPAEPVVLPEQECDDAVAQQVREYLNGLMQCMDCDVRVRVYLMEDGRYKAYFEGEKLGQLIGRRGETLDSIQQLTNYSINQGDSKTRIRVQLDAEDYRLRREQSLDRMARKVAERVVRYRRNVTLEPMNAYERHVVHTALQEFPNVVTHSIGVDPNRRIVVSYDRNKA